MVSLHFILMRWRIKIMKLSDNTVSVLKNYSTINQNLMIKSGSKLGTMSAMKNIFAKAEVNEEFRDLDLIGLRKNNWNAFFTFKKSGMKEKRRR